MPVRFVRFVVGFLIGVGVGFLAANTVGRRAPVATPAAGPAASTAPASGAGAASSSPDVDTKSDLSDEELARVKAAVDARPTDYEAQYKLAEFLLRIRRQPDEAVPYYTRATALEPTSPDPLMGLGDASFANALATGTDGTYDPKLLDAAASSYEKALKLAPTNPVIHATLGMTRALRKPPDYPRALREFRAALELDPKNEIALQGLASALAATGDVGGAEAAVAKLAEIDPENPGLADARQAIAAAKKRP